MPKYAIIREAEANLKNNTQKTVNWGLVVTLLAVASIFLGSSLIKVDLSFFNLYPLRLFGFIGVFFMLKGISWKDPFLRFCSRFFIFSLVVGLISILWAPDTILALKEFGIIQTGLTLSWLVFRYINTEERVEQVLKIWIIGSVFVNLIGLWEVWHQQYLIKTEVGTITENAIIRMGALAPRSIFGNQNNYAFFNSITSLVLLGMVIKRNWPIKLYLLNVLALSLSIYLLISSYSRAAIGGFALGVVCFVIFTFVSKNKYKTSLVKFALIGIGAFIVVLAVNTSLVDSFSKKLNLVIEKNEQKAEEGGNEGRVELYSKSIEYAAEHIGIGMGPGSSLVNLDGFPPHNYLIQILVDYGLVILLGQLWILFRVYQRLRIYQHVMQSALPSMLRASILAFPLLCVGPSSITGEGVFWLWLGFLIAYSSIMIRKYCST